MNISEQSKDLFNPLLTYLKNAEAEAYHCIERVTSPSEMLKTFLPEKKKGSLSLSTFFYDIYEYLFGVHEKIHHNILKRQRELIIEDHNLTELCQQLPLSDEVKDEVCTQLDQISLNRYHSLEHISQLNSILCFTKVGFFTLVGALSLGFIAKVFADQAYCIPPIDTRYEITKWLGYNPLDESSLEHCPSFSNPHYLGSTALYFIIPLFTVFQFFNQMDEGGLLSAFVTNPIAEGMSECNRISLGILIRISSVKDRILHSIR